MKETPEFTLTELYKGRVVVKFFEKSHQYWISIDGGPFARKTGVTTYIGIKDKSRPLQSWQQGITADYLLSALSRKEKITADKILEAVVQHEVQKNEAADIGKEIHGWCEKYIRNKLKQPGFESIPDMPNFPEAITGVNSFFAWEKAHKVQYVSTETPVYSMEEDFIGTEDLVAIIDGLFCDSDFKSSNGLYNGVRMQTAAYAKARMEGGGKKCQGRWAIRFSKYSEEEYMKREERKQEIRKAIARIQGNAVKDYPIKPYQVFEAKFLDSEKSHLDRDYQAFLTAKALHSWDKLTDPFYNGENW
jgi:hypothetical protein